MTIQGTAELRKMMNAALIDDAEFEAFCLDNFPEIRKRFSGNMDRLSKMNILLELGDSEKILQCLSINHRDKLDSQQAASFPLHLDRAAQELVDRLDVLYRQKEQAQRLGQDTRRLDAKIRTIKQRQRRAPQLGAGEMLGDRYRLYQPIGHGGFATVWQAYDRKRQSLVAIKILHSQWIKGSEQWSRFERGARHMARMCLHHPGFVKVLSEELNCEFGFYYFVMEYLAGGDLHRAVVEKRIPISTALRAVSDAGLALQYAHEQGLVHRDVKPQNILLDEGFRARLSDFDLVLASDTTGGTRTGPLGTYIYAAPEALEDARCADSRTDVYSLGMVALFVLHGATLSGRAAQRPAAFIEALEIPVAAKQVLLRATAFEPAERQPSARDFCQALIAAMASSADPATTTYALPKSNESSQKSKAVAPRLVVIAMGLLLSIVVAGRLAFTNRTPSVSPREAGSMIAIPSGRFMMGSNAFDDERPPHPVSVKAFKLDKTEVTLAAYQACVEVGACNRPEVGGACNWGQREREQHPINCVGFHDAAKYCRWAGKRLPTEEEWEYAARGTDGREYPWGSAAPAEQACWKQTNRHGTCKVGTYPAGQSPFGIFDLAGNVWEWTSAIYADCYDRLKCPDDPSLRIVRGGAWSNESAWYLRSSFRVGTMLDNKPYFVGFRCAMD